MSKYLCPSAIFAALFLISFCLIKLSLIQISSRWCVLCYLEPEVDFKIPLLPVLLIDGAISAVCLVILAGLWALSVFICGEFSK